MDEERPIDNYERGERRREKERKDRCPGSAGASYEYLFPKDGYDLTVDTYQSSEEECSLQIIDILSRWAYTSRQGVYKTLYSTGTVVQLIGGRQYEKKYEIYSFNSSSYMPGYNPYFNKGAIESKSE